MTNGDSGLITPLAVATVTAILKGQLSNWLARYALGAKLGAEVVVSALPPDRITTGADERPQLNLFLYSVSPNTALRRSQSAPLGQRARGEFLALDLHYLISAYGGSELQIETLLGYAIHAFQQLSSLDRDTLQAALVSLGVVGGELSSPLLSEIGAANLAEAMAELTVTPQFPDIEALTRIWSSLQARYRPSVVYKVSAVIIEARA
jgi:hypothetical protein